MREVADEPLVWTFSRFWESYQLDLTDPDICKRRILNLDLPGIPDHYTDSEKTLYFSSLISFDNITTVQIFWVDR